MTNYTTLLVNKLKLLKSLPLAGSYYVEHDDINLWDIGMMRFCCWRLFCGNLYRLGFCVTVAGRPTAEYPGYFGFTLGFNTPSLDSRMYRFWFM
jgi:hypothetical protein